MPHLPASENTDILLRVHDTAYNQSADLRLYYRAKIFSGQQRPAAPVKDIYRIRLTGNWLDTVERARNIVVFSLISIVYIAIMVIIRSAEPENQAPATMKAMCEVFILKQIMQIVAGLFDEKTAVLMDRMGAQPAIAGTDEMAGVLRTSPPAAGTTRSGGTSLPAGQPVFA